MALFDRKKKGYETARQELAQDPSPPKYVALIEKYVAAAQTQHALDLAKEGRERFPNSERIQQALQNIMRLLREKDVRSLQKQLEVEPSQAGFERLASIYLTDFGNKTKALEIASTGVAQFPGSDTLHLIVGQLHFDRFRADRLGEAFADARKALEAARQANPQNFKARLLLGRLLAEVGQRPAALEILEPLAAEMGDDLVQRLRAAVQGRGGQEVPDLDSALSSIEGEGRWPDGRDEYAAIFEEHGRAKVEEGAVRQFLDALMRVEGFRCATVVGSDGSIVGARGASIEDGEKFAAAVGRISRGVGDYAARMEIGSFVSGELKIDGDRQVTLASCRGYSFGFLSQGSKRGEIADAVERFVAMADEA